MILCLKCQTQMEDYAGSICPNCGWLFSEILKQKVDAVNYSLFHYSELQQELAALCKRGKLGPLKTIELYKALDYGLQTVLYQMAIKNNVVSFDEISFIKDITKNADIFKDNVLDVTFPQLNCRLSWDIMELPLFDEKYQAEIFELMVDTIMPQICNLISTVVAIDKQFGKVGTQSTSYKIEEKILQIAIMMADATSNTINSHINFEAVETAEKVIWLLFSSTREKFEKKMLSKYKN